MDRTGARRRPSRILVVRPSSPRGAVAELRAILDPVESITLSVSDRADLAPAPGPGGAARPVSAILLVLGRDGLEEAERVLRVLRACDEETPVVLVAEAEMAPEHLDVWLERGVADYLVRPLRASDVLPRLRRLASARREEEAAVARLKEKLGLGRIVGQSPAFLAQVRKIPVVARCPSSVLIRGETGTGKELVARSIHHLSDRSDRPFIAVSCAAIPETLAENELWGHVKGAYTGATREQRGLVAEADGGTLVLDDVDSLSPAVQAKLLRFLQEKEYRSLGSPRVHEADVRVLASTNADLEQETASGRFRLDLYHRLNVVPIRLPPLRERVEDIPLLAQHFVRRHAEELGVPPPRLTAAVVDRLVAYDWPGNVRELEHVIERAVILSKGGSLDPSTLMLPVDASDGAGLSFKEVKAQVVRRFERSYVERQLRAHDGNVTHAARASGKHRRAFYALVRKHGIDIDAFRS